MVKSLQKGDVKDYIVYCINLSRGCIDSIEVEFLSNLLKYYGNRLSLSFFLGDYIRINDGYI
jgi:hypothetical protein